MSYTIFVRETGKGDEDKGESWTGESIEERIALCDYQTITPLLLRYLPREGRILEAGCGLGRWVAYLSRKGYRIEGVELNSEAVNEIKKFDTTLIVHTGDVGALPYEDNSLSAIISLGVIEHFKEGPQRALREMYRVLKPRGILFITVPYLNILRRFLHIPYQAAVCGVRRAQGYTLKFGSYVYTAGEMRTFLNNAGFEITHVAPDDFIYPKSLGLYTDWTRYVGSRATKWELNALGKAIQKLLNLLSPWVWSNGIFFMANVKKG
jgi:SAM-dependent methyltransferase